MVTAMFVRHLQCAFNIILQVLLWLFGDIGLSSGGSISNAVAVEHVFLERPQHPETIQNLTVVE